VRIQIDMRDRRWIAVSVGAFALNLVVSAVPARASHGMPAPFVRLRDPATGAVVTCGSARLEELMRRVALASALDRFVGRSTLDAQTAAEYGAEQRQQQECVQHHLERGYERPRE
jgi:hypothetical protein